MEVKDGKGNFIMRKKVLLMATIVLAGILGLLCRKEVSFAEEGAFISKDTGLSGNEPFEDMECEQQPYSMQRTADGKAVYYQWLTPKASGKKVYLGINTLDGSADKKTRIIKSKKFREIANAGFNITRQDKKGNIYEIHNTRKESRLFWGKKEKPMNEYLCIYDKKGNQKARFKVAKRTMSSDFDVVDMYIKSDKIYIVFMYNKYNEKKSYLQVKVYNAKTGKKIRQNKVAGRSSTDSSVKVKYADSGLYILEDNSIERYSHDGRKLKNTYALPDNNKGLASVNGAMQMWDDLYLDNSDICVYRKECFSVTDSYIYYCNAGGLYRASIGTDQGFELIFNASNDSYFTGKYTFFDMVVVADDTFYVFMQEGSDDDIHVPTHIIMYKK